MVTVPVVVVALPARDTETEGSDAFEVRASVAVLVPPVVGAKVTERLALTPAGRIYGKDNPLAVKPLPVMVTPEIVRFDPPELDTVKSCV